jgi:hypothetical protein
MAKVSSRCRKSSTLEVELLGKERKRMIEDELKKKHLLSNEDKKIIHKLLCACIQRKKVSLSKQIRNEYQTQRNESSIQSLLEKLLKNPRLSWESLKKTGNIIKKLEKSGFYEFEK